jgi:ligand-binding sensor domain-containing protein
VRQLLPDRQGNIWLATNDGLYRIRRNSFRTWLNESGEGTGWIQSVVEDTEGRIWFLSKGRIGWVLQDEVHFAALPDNFGARIPLDATPAREGGILVSTTLTDSYRELWHWTPQVSRLVGRMDLWFDSRSMLKDRSGTLWIGTTAGLYRMEDDDLVEILVASEAEGKPVRALAEDRQGRVHAGVYGVGMFRLEAGGWCKLTQADDAAARVSSPTKRTCSNRSYSHSRSRKRHRSIPTCRAAVRRPSR